MSHDPATSRVPAIDRLTPILVRKRREIARRRAHLGLFDPRGVEGSDRRPAALAALRRAEGAPPRVIAEIKYASPSEGPIHPWRPGEGARLARAYVDGGAAAVSVLCDRVGFGGSVAELRRVARAIDRPVLFKEFVLDELQIDLARAAGASLVLLLVRALDPSRLGALVEACHERGLEPLVEAADADEVDRALDSGARVVGVNARDLATFAVDPESAERAIQKIVSGRVAVYMSGVSSRDQLERVARTRADAVLVGSALMRAPRPGVRLAEWLGSATESTT